MDLVNKCLDFLPILYYNGVDVEKSNLLKQHTNKQAPQS
jgi:hypothetical protein